MPGILPSAPAEPRTEATSDESLGLREWGTTVPREQGPGGCASKASTAVRRGAIGPSTSCSYWVRSATAPPLTPERNPPFQHLANEGCPSRAKRQERGWSRIGPRS